jgi:murein DD-endopeptidase
MLGVQLDRYACWPYWRAAALLIWRLLHTNKFLTSALPAICQNCAMTSLHSKFCQYALIASLALTASLCHAEVFALANAESNILQPIGVSSELAGPPALRLFALANESTFGEPDSTRLLPFPLARIALLNEECRTCESTEKLLALTSPAPELASAATNAGFKRVANASLRAAPLQRGFEAPNAQRSGHSDPLAEALIERAQTQLGTAYHFGGTTPKEGFDCSGFVGWVYRELLREPLPRVAEAMYKLHAPAVGKSDLRPGDLMFYRIFGGKVSHVSMYIGERKFIHATRPGQALRVESMDLPYWRQRFVGAKRVLGSELVKSEFQAYSVR